MHRTLRIAFLDQRPKRQAVGEITEPGKTGIVGVSPQRIHPAAIVVNIAFRRFGVFKAPVLDQLRVESAVHGVIEILQKDSIHTRIEPRAGLGRVNVDGGRARDQWTGPCQKKNYDQRADGLHSCFNLPNPVLGAADWCCLNSTSRHVLAPSFQS